MHGLWHVYSGNVSQKVLVQFVNYFYPSQTEEEECIFARRCVC